MSKHAEIEAELDSMVTDGLVNVVWIGGIKHYQVTKAGLDEGATIGGATIEPDGAPPMVDPVRAGFAPPKD